MAEASDLGALAAQLQKIALTLKKNAEDSEEQKKRTAKMEEMLTEQQAQLLQQQRAIQELQDRPLHLWSASRFVNGPMPLIVLT